MRHQTATRSGRHARGGARGAAGVAAAALGLVALAVLARPERPRLEDPRLAELATVAPGAAGSSLAEPQGRSPGPSTLAGPVAMHAGPPDGRAPLPVSDDLAQEREPPRADSEAAHYERFLELGRRRDGSLDALAEPVLTGAAPVDERVAMLRALWDSRAEDAAGWFKAALAAPATAAPEVPDFAVRFLSERAVREPVARTILTEHLAHPPAGCDAARLARAGAALEPAATSQEP